MESFTILASTCRTGTVLEMQQTGSPLINLKLDIGHTRPTITRGLSIYFWEPSGNRIEVYAGGYTAYPDNPQRIWDGGQLGRGLFY